MKKKHLQPLTPAALYARVSSDRQDVDLSVSAQLRALKDYARANGYSVAREYVDEAESGRVANRPQFREMIEEGSKPKAPFEVILVWKFSRFTRKREHAVAFKSQLRRKGIRVVSITEQAEDNATGRLLEGIIESVDEYYPIFPILGVFRLKGQSKRDGGIIVRSCKAIQSPVYPIRDAILAVNHASCPSLSSSGSPPMG